MKLESDRNLPPLEVGATYRLREFQSWEFEAQSLHRGQTGEDVAILRLHLANSTKLDIPISDEQLKNLMNVLMAAFPRAAIDQLRARWPNEFVPKD